MNKFYVNGCQANCLHNTKKNAQQGDQGRCVISEVTQLQKITPSTVARGIQIQKNLGVFYHAKQVKRFK